MDKLPVNAQQFFTPNKPNFYLYRSGSVPNGLITGRQVEIIGSHPNDVNTMENKPVHLVPPHLQPQVTTNRSTVIPPPIPPQPIQNHRTVTVTSVPPRAPKQPTVVKSTASMIQKPRCKYMVRAINRGCGCSSVECGNSECPLSKKLQSGTKAPINSHTCCKENCRWFVQS